jgi:hypothetical protein
VDELKCDSDAGEVLVGIFATNLIRIKHRIGWRRAFFFIGQVMIGNDYVEALVARPVERLVCANAAVDTDDDFVTIGECLFECRLLNAVAFSEAMWNVETGVCAE